jgi:hypothetical protein
VPYCSAPTSFYLSISSTDGTHSNNQLALQDWTADGAIASANAIIASTWNYLPPTTFTTPTIFTLNSNGYLGDAVSGQYGGHYSARVGYVPTDVIDFEQISIAQSEGLLPLICQIAQPSPFSCSFVLQCSVQGNTIFSYCPPLSAGHDEAFGLSIGTSIADGCTAVIVAVVNAS